MKVSELLLSQEQLNEIALRQAIAAGTLGLSMLSPAHLPKEADIPKPAATQVQAPAHILPAPKQIDPKQQKMAEKIVHKYSVDDQFALEVVDLAHKYAKPGFPTAKDILAVIGVESSYDPDSVSGLRKDPAVGLMQVRPHVWNLNRAELEGSTEKQIATGADILHFYYKKLHNRHAALAAYNVGLGEFRSGNNAEGYVSKYVHELKLLAGI